MAQVWRAHVRLASRRRSPTRTHECAAGVGWVSCLHGAAVQSTVCAPSARCILGRRTCCRRARRSKSPPHGGNLRRRCTRHHAGRGLVHPWATACHVKIAPCRSRKRDRRARERGAARQQRVPCCPLPAACSAAHILALRRAALRAEDSAAGPSPSIAPSP